jgi:hypothetical protein
MHNNTVYPLYHSPKPDIAAEKVRTSCRKRRVSGLGALGVGESDERSLGLTELAHPEHKKTRQPDKNGWGSARDKEGLRCPGTPHKRSVNLRSSLIGILVSSSNYGIEDPIATDRPTEMRFA